MREMACAHILEKGGTNVGIRDLRALRGVIENDLAMVGGLIVLEPLGERKT